MVALVWQAVAMLGLMPAKLFPGLDRIVATFVRLIATGVLSRTSCHPVAVSSVNVASASCCPPAVQRCPTWVPVLLVCL